MAAALDLKIKWESGKVDPETMVIELDDGWGPLAAIIPSDAMYEVGAEMPDDFLARVGGMQSWVERAIYAAYAAERLFPVFGADGITVVGRHLIVTAADLRAPS